MKLLLVITTILSCLPACVQIKPIEDSTQEKEVFHFSPQFYSSDSAKGAVKENNEYFIFERTPYGYGLCEKKSDISINDSVLYVKTFGGRSETVEIQVIGERFIIYPRTLEGSPIRSEPITQMKAVTEVYDLELHKVVFTSKAYLYSHDVPLIYEYNEVIKLAERTK